MSPSAHSFALTDSGVSFSPASGATLFAENSQSVLFVTSQLRPRELKMADGLRRIGWKVGLVYYKWTPFDPRDYFDFSFEVASAAEAHLCAQTLSPRLCHVFSGAIDDLVLLFCRDKPCPVVIDLNDVFAPSLFDYCQERFEPTREALALADGFCARDLQVKRAEQVDGFVLPPRVMLFPEYCWNAKPVPEKAARDIDSDEVHVVSVGTFSLETQGMFDSCYLQLARLFVDQRIHFHIYPHWSYRKDHSGSPHADLERDFVDFLALERSSSYLHVHDSLPLEQLAEVLPRYDFGIVSGGCAEFGQKLKFYKPAYLQTCYSGRIADYLDARLPVLINDEVAFDFLLLKRYGICIDLKGILRPGFKDELLAFRRDRTCRQRVDLAADVLSVRANVARLARFYSETIEAGTQRRRYVGAQLIPPVLPVPDAPSDATDRAGTFLALAKARALFVARRLARVLLPYRTIRVLEVYAHNVRIEKNSAQQENIALRAHIETLQEKGETLQKKSTALQTYVDEAGHRNAELRDRLAALKHRNETLHAKVAGLEALQAKVAERGARDVPPPVVVPEQSDAQLREIIQAYEREVGELTRQIQVLNNEKHLLQQRPNWGPMSINEVAQAWNWPEVLDDVSRSNGFAEFTRVLALFSGSKHAIDSPSTCWNLLALKNYDQLLTSGYDRFKRTLGHNYFNFLVQSGDPQITALESILPADVQQKCRDAVRSIPDDPGFTWHDRDTYYYFVLLLAEYAKSIDSQGYLARLREPAEGDPILVSATSEDASGGSLSQDLANSLVEYYSIGEGVDFNGVKSVLEIGGGYGRNAHVILTLNPHISVTMVDIPPALFIAQRYLASVFKERRVFKVRDFSRYDDVRDEMENASIVFLMPHQLELMPDNYFDLGMNVSSFGEMRMDQIRWYFEALRRTTRGHFYMKQWLVSKNPLDGNELREKDYPYPAEWKNIYSRTCRVQAEFFEALYRTHAP